ncbi:N-acetylmuramic acid 6-phosphate etherase [Mycoplasma buteonis]|uniref:N-acetylmuramic acid 6-phosphate etherase n=1 Tax=Mycoplasma buteonis TaxID=171280 RepID=UPI000560D78D|nr:N-acetylmuramic acid 6-phosphate etherase [Mycoplasma buteonis]
MEKLDVYSVKHLIWKFENSNEIVLKAINDKNHDLMLIIEEAINCISNGGKVVYVGAGTSGRIGMLDSLDVLPTFGEKKWFTYSMAGGDKAVLKSLEGFEDDFELGESDAIRKKIGPNDLVIALSASGNTKYCMGFLKQAQHMGAQTALIANRKNGKIEQYSDFKLIIEVGAEIILGSTRLNSATAQKIVLNMISSITAIKMGKVYDQHMIDLTPINDKLIQRSIDIISDIAMCSEDVARTAYHNARQNVKIAVVMASKNISYDEARALLKRNHGHLRKVINEN